MFHTQQWSQPPVAAQAQLFTLFEAIFATTVSQEMHERLAHNQDVFLQIAFDTAGKAVGFKVGYREDPITFYSWLGGVLPEYRGHGIAARLMDEQHTWCRAHSYQYVRTKTLNQWRGMLLLNIKTGFDIIGTQTGRNGVVKIVLEKKL
jgi:GNAT superfamily N-acetyltransferase